MNSLKGFFIVFSFFFWPLLETDLEPTQLKVWVKN
jgi:hypothetical protein